MEIFLQKRTRGRSYFFVQCYCQLNTILRVGERSVARRPAGGQGVPTEPAAGGAGRVRQPRDQESRDERGQPHVAGAQLGAAERVRAGRRLLLQGQSSGISSVRQAEPI